ncbi:MAG: phosphoglycerate dehydrogenase [Gemmatimonadota bacterium]|nr:phosphoglycerate dehydrogenase [Gemmatimonadota bacterium]
MSRGTAAPGGKRLIIADPLRPEGIEVLSAATGLEVEDHTEDDRETLSGALAGASGLIVRSRTKVDAELMERSDSLEVIGRAGVGVDNIDMEAATRRGIAVLNAPAANTFSTAELAFALLLAAARHVTAADASIRAGEWKRKAMAGTQLLGKTIGVVGAGRIGAEVIRRARAFGMHVVAYDPYVPADRANELGLSLVTFKKLLESADIVTLHVPLTGENRGLIGADEISRMRDGAILINAARGGLVDEAALAAALVSGKLRGAGLDVFEREPLPADSPLREAPNLVFTPHIGASTSEAQAEVSRQIAVAVRDALLSANYQTALNAPFEEGERGRIAPVMELGRRLGILLGQLDDGRCQRIEVEYAGTIPGVLRPLAAAALEGFLTRQVEPPLNVVNALSIAGERGIEVARVRTGVVRDYTNHVLLRATHGAGEDELIVSGALLGEGEHTRIVRIDDFHVNTEPTGTLLLVQNRDIPGVIGEVGTLLGAAGVNIGQYHQARTAVGGSALGVVTIDGAVPGAVLDEICSIDAVTEVRQVIFDA